jgi:hypothetical protein
MDTLVTTAGREISATGVTYCRHTTQSRPGDSYVAGLVLGPPGRVAVASSRR